MTIILVLEDYMLIREMITERLKQKGYGVISAANGIEGIEKATRELPDLILMDLSLPGMDGRQVAKKLRSQPETQAIPIIVLTAHTDLLTQDPDLLSHCEDYEIKPINFPQLTEKIERLVKK